MQDTRRGLLKTASILGAVGAIGTVSAISASSNQSYSSSVVVVGKSPKKEILYKKTQIWEDYLQSAK